MNRLLQSILKRHNPREQRVNAPGHVLQGSMDLLQDASLDLDVLSQRLRELRDYNLQRLIHERSVGPDAGGAS